jgi:hypothetical protein
MAEGASSVTPGVPRGLKVLTEKPRNFPLSEEARKTHVFEFEKRMALVGRT